MIKSLTQSILVIFVISTFSCRSNETVVKKFTDGVYKGEIDKKGNKHGKGLIIWNDGSSYEGEFKKIFGTAMDCLTGTMVNPTKVSTQKTHEPASAFISGLTVLNMKDLF